MTLRLILLTLSFIFPAPPAHPNSPQAVLHEEAFETRPALISPGWAAWTVEPDKTAPPALLVRAFATIPDRGFKLLITWRRNLDPVLPVSHTIELLFDAPQDPSINGVASVSPLLMKADEADPGLPLTGLSRRVTESYFIIGLPLAEPDRTQNASLLLRRDWIDASFVYANGRRAFLRLSKGPDGRRAFDEAFASWRQDP